MQSIQKSYFIRCHKLVSFELIVDDDDEGRIKYRSVSLKPYPVTMLLIEVMYERLKKLVPGNIYGAAKWFCALTG